MAICNFGVHHGYSDNCVCFLQKFDMNNLDVFGVVMIYIHVINKFKGDKIKNNRKLISNVR